MSEPNNPWARVGLLFAAVFAIYAIGLTFSAPVVAADNVSNKSPDYNITTVDGDNES